MRKLNAFWIPLNLSMDDIPNNCFLVHPGEIVALLGPNGAGKTTAISLMLGLRKPTSGTVTLFGGDPRRPSSHRQVASMLQVKGP